MPGRQPAPASMVHMAVDTLGYLLAMHVAAANEHERAQVYELAQQVHEVTGDTCVPPLSTKGIRALSLIKWSQIVLCTGFAIMALPSSSSNYLKRTRTLFCYQTLVCGTEFCLTGCFRRLASEYERLTDTLVSLHLLAFAILMLKNVVQLFSSSA